MLNEEELRDAALLVFANKQDQPGAKGAGDISEALRLGELKDRNWTIVACSAIDGRGVSEGMDWMVVSLHSLPLLSINSLPSTNSFHSKPCNKSHRDAKSPIHRPRPFSRLTSCPSRCRPPTPRRRSYSLCGIPLDTPVNTRCLIIILPVLP
jgi:hypothetical protein